MHRKDRLPRLVWACAFAALAFSPLASQGCSGGGAAPSPPSATGRAATLSAVTRSNTPGVAHASTVANATELTAMPGSAEIGATRAPDAAASTVVAPVTDAISTASPIQPAPKPAATAPPSNPALPGQTRTPTVIPQLSPTPVVGYNADRARLLLPEVMIHAADLPGPWTTRELEQSNAELAAADPELAKSTEGCGRLLGRSSLLQPEDVIAAYGAGTLVAVSSSVGAYESSAGAAACFAAALQRAHQPGELGASFGSLFPDPAKVTVQFVDAPRLGDESFAATADGTSKYFAFIIPLTIYVVEFRIGNFLAIVAITSHPAPSADDLAAFASLVLDRIVANR